MCCGRTAASSLLAALLTIPGTVVWALDTGTIDFEDLEIGRPIAGHLVRGGMWRVSGRTQNAEGFPIERMVIVTDPHPAGIHGKVLSPGIAAPGAFSASLELDNPVSGDSHRIDYDICITDDSDRSLQFYVESGPYEFSDTVAYSVDQISQMWNQVHPVTNVPQPDTVSHEPVGQSGSMETTAQVNFVPNKWHHVRMDIFISQNKYDFYLDGKPMFSGNFKNVAQGGANLFEAISWGHNHPPRVYIDNVRVYVPTRGDLNDDGVADREDIMPFVIALTSGDASDFAQRSPQGYFWAADMNDDGVRNHQDVSLFSQILEKPALERLVQLIVRGHRLTESGQDARAVETYSQVVDSSSDYGDLVVLARRACVELLLEQDPVDIDVVERHLDALPAEGTPDEPRLREYAGRLLLRRVKQAPIAARKYTWTKGLNGLLDDDEAVLPEAILEDLEGIVLSMEDEGELSRLQILTDLLTLIPDVAKMHTLQQWRAKLLADVGSWDDACKAAHLSILLASASPKEPLEAIRQSLTIMKTPGLPKAARESLEASMQSSEAGDPTNASPAAPLQIDATLQQAATAILDSATGLSPRRRAYLLLFAGRPEEGVREIARVLLGAPVGGNQIVRVLEDIIASFSIADGHVRRADRALRALGESSGRDEADPQADQLLDSFLEVAATSLDENLETREGRQSALFGALPRSEGAEIAREALERWQRRLIAWGATADLAGKTAWAQACWAPVVNRAASPAETNRLIDSIVEKMLEVPQSYLSTIGVLHDLLGHLQQPSAQGHLRMEIATICFKNADFDQALSEFNQADALLPENQRQPDMEIGFMRAMSLIRLERSTEALDQLDRMSGWSGTDEQEARVLFLLGWLNLHQSRPQQALSYLRDLTERYPATSFAEKAAQLIKRIEKI